MKSLALLLMFALDLELACTPVPAGARPLPLIDRGHAVVLRLSTEVSTSWQHGTLLCVLPACLPGPPQAAS